MSLYGIIVFYWRLKQDGMIDYEIKLSGELSTNLPSATEDPENPTHGVLVSPGVNAQVHQHMFCARLDMAVVAKWVVRASWNSLALNLTGCLELDLHSTHHWVECNDKHSQYRHK